MKPVKSCQTRQTMPSMSSGVMSRRIHTIDAEPFAVIPFMDAGPSGRPHSKVLPLYWGYANRLPLGVEALVLAADLQGRELGGGARLLGEVVADHLGACCDASELPAASAMGIILAGDLYAKPGCTSRGGLGDTTAVWQAFADRFRWAAGVLGNHDQVNSDLLAALARPPGVLDGSRATYDGVRIGGVSGIIGSPGKANRKSPAEYEDMMLDVLKQRPDILVLHESPGLPALGLRGSEVVAEVLGVATDLLVVCGHCPWERTSVDLPGGVQVMNVDGRVVVVTAKPSTP